MQLGLVCGEIGCVYSFKCVQFILLLSPILVIFSLKEVCAWALIPMATVPLDVGLDSQLYLKSGYGRKRLVYCCVTSRKIKVHGNPLGQSVELYCLHPFLYIGNLPHHAGAAIYRAICRRSKLLEGSLYGIPCS